MSLKKITHFQKIKLHMCFLVLNQKCEAIKYCHLGIQVNMVCCYITTVLLFYSFIQLIIHSYSNTCLSPTVESLCCCMCVSMCSTCSAGLQPREGCEIDPISFEAETCLYCAGCRSFPGPSLSFYISKSQQRKTGPSIHYPSQLCSICLLTLICFPLLNYR